MLLCVPNLFFCILTSKIGGVTSCFSEAILLIYGLSKVFVGIQVGSTILKFMITLEWENSDYFIILKNEIFTSSMCEHLIVGSMEVLLVALGRAFNVLMYNLVNIVPEQQQ